MPDPIILKANQLTTVEQVADDTIVLLGNLSTGEYGSAPASKLKTYLLQNQQASAPSLTTDEFTI